ncbi:MAG: glycosyltransferase family 2 protein [Patescibacteria group bacterium]
MNKLELSIIILSFNTKDLLRDCLNSLKKVKGEALFEVIVADNGSIDGSIEMVESDFSNVKLIKNDDNLGFAKGNNAARKVAMGKNILFLNSDTVVYKNTIRETIKYLNSNKNIGAVTCKTVLVNGKLDPDSRRRFPTPLISFNRLILGNGKLYWYRDVNENLTHEVEVIQGAFFLTRKKILDEVNWFSEEYFLDGEDIDLCWKIKEKGYKIYYFPKVSILHLKGASKGKNETKKKVPLTSRLKFRMASVNSMEIFYKKFLWKRYPLPINLLVLTGIKLLKLGRFVRTILH